MIEKAKGIVRTLQEKGFTAVFVGGCVRDQIMGIEPNDIDIATNATPDEVESMFPKTIPVGKSFGVMIVVVDGIEFEVATFRKDSNSSDGRRPDSVNLLIDGGESAMIADAERRDFTINSMFFDPIAEKLYDFFGGEKDIERKVIRFVGDPSKRIQEDKLRMLRAIRFAIRFDFKIESTTKISIKSNADYITEVSQERIQSELVKMFKHDPYKALNMLDMSFLLDSVLPEVLKFIGCEQPPNHHPEGDVFRHTLLALRALPKEASNELIWATLLHDVGKPSTQRIDDNGKITFYGHAEVGVDMCEDILRRLKFPTAFIKRVQSLVGNHMRWMHVQNMRESKLKKFISMDNFDEHIELHRADSISSQHSLENIDFVNGLTYTKDEIKPKALMSGKEIIDMGVKPSPEISNILKAIEVEQLENRISTKEQAKIFVEQIIKG
jgi:poly(A) polymerase